MRRITILLFILILPLINMNAQRKMENLRRGLIAVRADENKVFISWRVLGYEFNDSITYNLYRNDSLIAGGLDISNYIDSTDINGTYQVSAIVKDIEQDLSSPCSVTTYKHGSNTLACIRIPIKYTSGYTTRCLWVGDLDGDREYDYVLAKTIADDNAPTLLEAYTRHGDFLWQLNCGPNSHNKDNISPGSSTIIAGHGDNLTVYDINNDGFAEAIVRTANGVVFGDGSVLNEVNNKKQFISVLEGTTGKELARAEVSEDFIDIGPMNGHMGIAYLNGIDPSVVWSSKNRRSDGGFNMMVSTYNWQNDSLVLNWKFNRETSGLSLPDGHNIRIIDVDGDGKDEITPFGYTLDDDGSVLYNLGDHDVVHGDRFFIGDMDPTHDGLEGYCIQQENPNGLIWYYYDAKTGMFLHSQYENPIVQGDYARGYVGDMDPRYPYYEFFTFTDGLYNVDGSRITTSKPDSYPNFRIWWDDDLLSENLDNKKMAKWDYIADIDNHEIRLYTFKDVNQDPRKTPAFYGDILGDWREEVIYMSSDERNILIFTTVTPTTTKLYTLPHNPGYRNCFTVRGYYQGHMLDYYLGTDMELPSTPNIEIIGKNESRRLPNGFFQIKPVHSELSLDTTKGVTQQEYNDTITQVWRIIRNGENYEIYSMAAHKFLGYTADSVNADIILTDSSSRGFFKIIETENLAFSIITTGDSSLVFDIKDATLNTDGVLQLADSTGEENQQFIFVLLENQFDCNHDWKGSAYIDDCYVCVKGNTGINECTQIASGLYKIKPLHSDMCLQDNNSYLTQETCINDNAQVWRVYNTSDGNNLILCTGTYKYMEFSAADSGEYITSGYTSSVLRFERNVDGSYFIKPAENIDLYYEVEQNSMDAGTKILLNGYNGQDNQKFVFENYIVGIKEINRNSILVNSFPNPVTDVLKLIISDEITKDARINIFDNLGNSIFSGYLKEGVNSIEMKNVSPGVYYARILSENNTQIIKLIKD